MPATMIACPPYPCIPEPQYAIHDLDHNLHALRAFPRLVASRDLLADVMFATAMSPNLTARLPFGLPLTLPLPRAVAVAGVLAGVRSTARTALVGHLPPLQHVCVSGGRVGSSRRRKSSGSKGTSNSSSSEGVVVGGDGSGGGGDESDGGGMNLMEAEMDLELEAYCG